MVSYKVGEQIINSHSTVYVYYFFTLFEIEVVFFLYKMPHRNTVVDSEIDIIKRWSLAERYKTSCD